MIREKSAGAVVFRKENSNYFFLLLYKKANDKYKESWDFPRGNVEKDESEIDAVKREVKEEAGINALNIFPDFRDRISWFYKKDGQLIFKEVIYYLAETSVKDIQISFEHDAFEWLCFDDALKRITFKNAKIILENAFVFLKKRDNESLNKYF